MRQRDPSLWTAVAAALLTLCVLTSAIGLYAGCKAQAVADKQLAARPIAPEPRPTPPTAVTLSGRIEGVPLDGLVLQVRGVFSDGQRCDFDAVLDADGKPREVIVQAGTDPSRVSPLYAGVPLRLAGEE